MILETLYDNHRLAKLGVEYRDAGGGGAGCRCLRLGDRGSFLPRASVQNDSSTRRDRGDVGNLHVLDCSRHVVSCDNVAKHCDSVLECMPGVW